MKNELVLCIDGLNAPGLDPDIAKLPGLLQLVVNQDVTKLLETNGYNLHFLNRSIVDKTDISTDHHDMVLARRFIQVLPYILVTDNTGQRVLTYNRTFNSGESRLAGKASIGFGGHVNPCDLKGASGDSCDHPDIRSYSEPGVNDFSLKMLLETCVVRELREELGIELGSYDDGVADVIQFKGVIYDNVTSVDAVHLCVLVQVKLTEKQTINLAENSSFFNDEVAKPRWLTANELNNEANLENWSDIARAFFINDYAISESNIQKVLRILYAKELAASKQAVTQAGG